MKTRRTATGPNPARRTVSNPRTRLRIQSTGSSGDFAGRRASCQSRCSGACRKRNARHEPLRRAADRLRAHLEQSLAVPDTIAATDLAAFVSALALTELVISQEDPSKEVQPDPPQSSCNFDRLPLAESVVDYPVYEDAAIDHDDATERFLWRRELEDLWRKHITKDEFHRPVVRSLGLPVLVIVDHVRAGRSWKSICENYPGLVWDDIRAAVSMATECGWLEQE
ncbi:DUF433 domain-containing protein [bacterium]|nr:DUF433 domain-containing protein [bacterium]